MATATVTAQTNEAVMHRFYEEILNKGNLDIADEMRHPESARPQAHQKEDTCAHCNALNTCELRAELETVMTSRDILAADFGWDVLSFIAEAKRQYLAAKEQGCPSLGEVKRKAAALAPEVDFDRL